MANKISRDTIGDISRRSAARYRDKVAIVFRDISLTFLALEQEICRFANLMLTLGISKGDRVALFAHNSHFYPIVFMGLAKIGGIQVPINFMLNGEEVAYIINHSGAKAFIVEDSLFPVIATVKDKLTSVRFWGFIPLQGMATPSGFFDLPAEMGRMPADEPDIEIYPEDIAQIPYTSGTEARPKGAMLSHRALMSQYFSCIIDGEYETEDISLHALPLFHCAQLHCFLTPMLYRGAKNIILHRADPQEMIASIARYKVTHLFAPPTVWIAILNHPDLMRHDLSSLKKAAYGASSMPIEVIKQLVATFPGLRLWNYYGQTEMGPTATMLKPEFQLTKPGSAGKPILNVETRLLDDEGRFVPVGEVGEICHRSGHVMSGYLDDPEKTAEAFAYGWFHSGDLGKFDEDGFLYIVDRKKDMIKTGGENVSSREVEEVLYQHPDIVEAAVFGLPDPKWIEMVAAAVVLRKGAVAKEENIISFCRERLAGFKSPKRVFILDQLPKNPAGKILKRELRSRLAAVDNP